MDDAAPASGAVTGVWAPERRALTVGLVLTVTLVAFESLAVATIAPEIERDLGGLSLYGWVFSGFFLGSLVGTVVAGQLTDHRGPALAYLLGLLLFAGGLALGGLAPSMFALVVARVVQGLGAGAMPAVAYAVVGGAYPEELRPRMFAVTSTAWVVPGLAGPALAGAIAAHTSWRFVFLGLLPLVVGAGALALPALRSVPFGAADGGGAGAGVTDATGGPSGGGDAAGDGSGEGRVAGRLAGALSVAAGVALVLAALTADRWWLVPPLLATGLAVGVPAFVRLVPPGTVRAEPGLPASVLVRGLLTFAFFGADAYVPLALTGTRGTSTTVAGIAVTAATLSWTTGSWVQERFTVRVGPRRLVTIGHAVLVVGIAGAALILWNGVPLPLVVAVWAVAGFGIGLAYSPITFAVLREAPPGRRGEATASMQLSDLVGVALGTGVGGAAVAVGDAAGWVPDVGLGIAFAAAAAVGVLGLAVARRLPGPA